MLPTGMGARGPRPTPRGALRPGSGLPSSPPGNGTQLQAIPWEPCAPPRSRRGKGTPVPPHGGPEPQPTPRQRRPPPRGLGATAHPALRDGAKGTPRPCPPPSGRSPRAPVPTPWGSPRLLRPPRGTRGAAPHPGTQGIPHPIPPEAHEIEKKNKTPPTHPCKK